MLAINIVGKSIRKQISPTDVDGSYLKYAEDF